MAFLGGETLDWQFCVITRGKSLLKMPFVGMDSVLILKYPAQGVN